MTAWRGEEPALVGQGEEAALNFEKRPIVLISPQRQP
jgi:hypothetical protein